jgi:IclR family acetate operon transcriptional repressor
MAADAEQATEPGTETANRVADVLLLFGGGARRLGVSAISRQLGVSKAVVYRLLQSLVSRQLLALGAVALNQFDARTVAAPILLALRDRTDETTTLSWLIGADRVYVDQYESGQEIKMTVPVGVRFPLHAGASSKVILAFLPERRQAEVLAGPLPALTDDTLVDPAALRAELAEIAGTRVAVSLGERQTGAGSVAAPLLGPDGIACGAISVCGPHDRFTPDRCARYRELVRAAAEEIVQAWSSR